MLELPSCREEKRKKKCQNPKPARTFQVRENLIKREYKLINTKRVMMCKFRTPDDDDDVVDKNESTV